MKPDKTSNRITRRVLDILKKQGPPAVSMRRIAWAVSSITPMAIYHHFRNRDALSNSITDREFRKLLGHIQAHPLRGGAQARLIAVMEEYVDYAFAAPRVFDYVFSRARPEARQFPRDFRARRSPTLNPVADMVAATMQRCGLKNDDVWEIAFALWAHVHGYDMLYRRGRIGLSEKEFRQLVTPFPKEISPWLQTLTVRTLESLPAL